MTTDGALVDAMFDALNGCKTCQRLVRNPCLIAECVLASSGALELDDSSFVVQIASVAFFWPSVFNLPAYPTFNTPSRML